MLIIGVTFCKNVAPYCVNNKFVMMNQIHLTKSFLVRINLLEY